MLLCTHTGQNTLTHKAVPLPPALLSPQNLLNANITRASALRYGDAKTLPAVDVHLQPGFDSVPLRLLPGIQVSYNTGAAQGAWKPGICLRRRSEEEVVKVGGSAQCRDACQQQECMQRRAGAVPCAVLYWSSGCEAAAGLPSSWSGDHPDVAADSSHLLPGHCKQGALHAPACIEDEDTAC